jgi:zinc transport system substrate-binding protein
MFLFLSCNSKRPDQERPVITVSIAPFKYFVDQIAEGDFVVNIMVAEGADPHIYEPFPDQINKLRTSVAYISNGYLGFEMIWLDRFYEANRNMRRLSLGDNIDLIKGHNHEGDHVEGADPHYWESPKCASKIAFSVKELLCELNPLQKERYEKNYLILVLKIEELDKKAENLLSGMSNKTFVIFHPNFGYLARDYGIEEISLEFEGKEPSPLRMKELIDHAKRRGLKTVFVQRQYDAKTAEALADEFGAEVKIIDPLSEDWLQATTDIIIAIHDSLIESSN